MFDEQASKWEVSRKGQDTYIKTHHGLWTENIKETKKSLKNKI